MFITSPGYLSACLQLEAFLDNLTDIVDQLLMFFNVLSYREKGFNKSYTVCGGEQRTKNIYISTSNIIEITLTEMALEAGQFVLHYQGNLYKWEE